MNGSFNRVGAAVVSALTLLPSAAIADAGKPVTLARAWSATVTVSHGDVPFRFEIAEQRGVLTGAFFDGDERIVSSRGRFLDNVVTLVLPQYGARIEAA